MRDNKDIGKDDDDWERPNRPNQCTYKVQGHSLDVCPHIFRDRDYYKADKIKPSVMYCMNNSPLIRINRISKNDDIPCEILAKCEFFNPGGSVKDRIAVRMIEDAEQQGLLKSGYVLIEPTSGNTGIGLAITAAIKGYKCIIVISEKMSKEKVDIMKALGAEIIQTPTIVSYDSPSSNYRMASKLSKEIPHAYILNQFRNASNPLAHYDGTAEEILEACDGRLDMVVCSTGTGGTLSGIARKIKEKLPNCLIIGVDPVGSTLANPPELNKADSTFYEIEGIGDDFIPTTLDRNIIDRWYKVTDKEAFGMARRLIGEEGLLCGGSSGAAMHCAIKAARDFNLKKNMKVVVVLPDSIRNYMTKFLSDEWMVARSFLNPPSSTDYNFNWWRSREVKELPPRPAKSMPCDTKVLDALKYFTNNNTDIIFVVGILDSKIKGTLSPLQVMRSVMAGQLESPIEAVMNKNFKQILSDENLASLASLLEKECCILVFKSVFFGKSSEVLGYLNKVDLAAYIYQHSPFIPQGNHKTSERSTKKSK